MNHGPAALLPPAFLVAAGLFEGREDALPAIAAELARLRLDVIVAESTVGIQAAKTVTQTVPIVMATSADPVGTGLVVSLNRPGGNITGLSLQTAELSGKRLQLLTELVPGLTRVGQLAPPRPRAREDYR
jgi:putative ABC transport system substrate-binding protein